jgi:hypothetical protein
LRTGGCGNRRVICRPPLCAGAIMNSANNFDIATMFAPIVVLMMLPLGPYA